MSPVERLQGVGWGNFPITRSLQRAYFRVTALSNGDRPGEAGGESPTGGHIIFTALDKFRSRLSGDQRGFITIAELSIAALIAIPVLAAIMGFSLLSLKSERATAAIAQTTSLERTVLARLTRELRQGKGATLLFNSPGLLLVQRSDGSYWLVSCLGDDNRPGHVGMGEHICVRNDFQSSTTQPTTFTAVNPVTLVEGVTNTDVFTVSGRFVGVKLSVRPDAGRPPIILEDGIVYRNGVN